jgi:hypothetical protein
MIRRMATIVPNLTQIAENLLLLIKNSGRASKALASAGVFYKHAGLCYARSQLWL